MPEFADIHIHALYGVDDGAKTIEESMEILKTAYKAGTRAVCLTPHYSPLHFGDNGRLCDRNFGELKKACLESFPELKLFMGNELFYDKAFQTHLGSGCRTLGDTDNVLVDFRYDEDADIIEKALKSIYNAGYRPVLAHAEKYKSLKKHLNLLFACKRFGIVIQLDSDSVLGRSGLGTRLFAMELLKSGLADAVASDAHNLTSRAWNLDKCY